MCRRLFVLVTTLALGAGCVDKGTTQNGEELVPAAQEAKPSQAPPADSDAAPESPPDTPVPSAPLTGTHLDGASTAYRPATYPPTAHRRPPAKGKTIELVLRSTPPGATASIDGKPIGSTPTFWRGVADGQPHEYTFTKKGYSMARYRFVATQSGVVHGSLAALVISNEAEPASDAKSE